MSLYRFGLELLGPDGRSLLEAQLERPDFDRAAEAVFFDALRRGAFPGYAPNLDKARIEPRFARPDRPHVEGFDIVLPTPAGEQRRTFSPDFFHGLARRTSARLAVEGSLTDGTVLYRLNAYQDAPPARKAGFLLDLEPESVVPIHTGSRQGLGAVQAWDNPDPGELSVVIPRHVIDEAVAEARRQPEREVGGVLLGHLRRDGDKGDLFLEVTALVPCEETEATKVSVTFTHATWARVREVAEWRGEKELIVGWVHSHPFRFCAECPNPPKPDCISKVLFYSDEDEFLMETTFPRPFMVGLLTAVESRLEGLLGHPPVMLFGWNEGKIVPRGFEVI